MLHPLSVGDRSRKSSASPMVSPNSKKGKKGFKKFKKSSFRSNKHVKSSNDEESDSESKGKFNCFICFREI